MNFNDDKCSVMNIEHNNIQGNNASPIHSCQQQMNSETHLLLSSKTSSAKTNREKVQNTSQSTEVSNANTN